MNNQSKSDKKSIFQEFVDVALENLPLDVSPELRKKIIAIIDRFLGPIFQDIERRRLPRLALVGRTRSGKSSLINAIFGREVVKVGAVRSVTTGPEVVKWATLRDNNEDDEMIEILDTRGVQEGIPPEGAPAISSLESVMMAIREQTPDMFLFLEKATEVNAAVMSDLDTFAKCLRASKAIHDGKEMYPLVIGIPTQCDQLSPPGFWSVEDRQFYSAYWDADKDGIPRQGSHADFEYRLEKLDNIREAVSVWTQHLLKIPEISPLYNLKVSPTTAQMRFRVDKSLDTDARTDLRWNIEELKNLIMSELPSDAQIEFFRLARVKTGQHKYADKIILATSGICTAVGALPTPAGFDLPFLLGTQILQIMLIGFVSGRKLSWDTASEFLKASGLQAGAGFLLREGFRAAAKFIPVAGWLVSGGIAGGATLASGKLAVAYFIDGKKMTWEETKHSVENLISSNKGDG